MKLYLLSLGCARNLVDSEIMLGRIKGAGWTIVEEPEGADAIVVNTCSFIEDAADESIDMILELAQYKQTGSCKRLVVAGCLPERYRQEITGQMPEVDAFIGTGAYDQIVAAVEGSNYRGGCLLPDPDPKLRGKKRSRPLPEVISEARSLLEAGVKELVLVAQDTTSYGKDLQPEVNLSQLIESLADLPAVPPMNSGTIVEDNGPANAWIRVLYGHPQSIEDSFIKTVATHSNVCSYFDIPIQHVSSSILKKMGRHYTREDLCRLFDKIRSQVADAVLRTTLILGFPGETDKDFEALLGFIEDVRFDHLGIFLYSDADDLPSHRLPEPVPAGVARERYDQLMSCQLDISAQNYQKYIGQTLQVLVEEAVEDRLYAGRATFQAPEVDGMTYIKIGHGHPESKIGSFARIKVTDAMEYDLIGDSI
jgi:ribosomal protein S12 methylthiotransferase